MTCAAVIPCALSAAGSSITRMFAVDPADALDGGDARLAEQPLGDVVVDVPAELLERHVRVCAPMYEIGLVLGVDARDLRLEDSLGKVAADLRDGVADVVDGAIGRGAELELDEGGAVALDHRADISSTPLIPRIADLDPLRDLRLELVRRGAGLRHVTTAAGKSMSGALLTCIREKETSPASISPTNSTIGATGLRMHQDEMFRKFMRAPSESGVLCVLLY